MWPLAGMPAEHGVREDKEINDCRSGIHSFIQEVSVKQLLHARYWAVSQGNLREKLGLASRPSKLVGHSTKSLTCSPQNCQGHEKQGKMKKLLQTRGD